jgi:ferredoxin
MRITADVTACVGAGQCALVAGGLFDQDDDGIVVILNARPEGAEVELARRAASLCPSRAITVHVDE